MGKKPTKSPELKVASLNLRIRPAVKAMAEHMAAHDRRSVAAWVELLIEAEAARRGLS
jgi:predicted HicB family RNase H-like nuclease